jgi:hypothetical protein
MSAAVARRVERMRVIRRTPPSRVGYGASVGRRRLLHTYVEETVDPEEQTVLANPDLDFLVHLNVDASRHAANLIRWQRAESQTLVATLSKARGR